MWGIRPLLEGKTPHSHINRLRLINMGSKLRRLVFGWTFVLKILERTDLFRCLPHCSPKQLERIPASHLHERFSLGFYWADSSCGSNVGRDKHFVRAHVRSQRCTLLSALRALSAMATGNSGRSGPVLLFACLFACLCFVCLNCLPA